MGRCGVSFSDLSSLEVSVMPAASGSSPKVYDSFFM